MSLFCYGVILVILVVALVAIVTDINGDHPEDD